MSDQQDTGFGTITRRQIPMGDPMAAGQTTATLAEPPAVPEVTPSAPPQVPSSGTMNIKRRSAPVEQANVPTESPRDTILRLSPDPAQADAKLQVSQALGDWLRMHPADVHQNFDLITQKMYGDEAKNQPPANILQKTTNMIKGLAIQSELDDLNGKRFEGIETPEILSRVDELKKEQAALGPQPGWLPKGIVGMLYQLGYQGVSAAGTFAAAAMSVISGEALAHTIGIRSDSPWMDISSKASEKLVGTLVGGVYGTAIDRGIDPSYARMLAGGLGALQIGLMAVPIGGEAAGAIGSVVVKQAVAEGVAKATLKGALDAVAAPLANRLVMGMGKQALFAAGMSGVNAVLPEVAASLSNRLKGTDVAIKDPSELATEFGQGFLTQFLVGAATVGAHEGLRQIAQPHIEKAVSELADKESARLEAGAEPKVEAAPSAPEAQVNPIRAAEREAAKTRTVGDVLENEPTLPKAKPTESAKPAMSPEEEMLAAQNAPVEKAGAKPAVSEAQLSDMITKAKAAHGEDISFPGIKKSWQDSVTVEDGEAIFWYNDKEGGTHAIREPLQEASPDTAITPRPVDSELAKQEAEAENWLSEMNIPKKTPETPSPEIKIGDIKGKETPLNKRMTADEASAIDLETRSDEGSSEYIRQNPEIEALSKEVEDLQSKIDRMDAAAKKIKEDHGVDIANLKEKFNEKISDIKSQAKQKASEAWSERLKTIQDLRSKYISRIEELKADIPAAKQAIREQIKTRSEVKQAIRQIEAVDTSNMRPEYAEPVKKIMSNFTTENFNKNTTAKLNELRTLLEDHPEMDLPRETIRKLGELDKTPLKSLSPEDVLTIRDAITHYAKLQRDAQKVMIEGRVAEKDAVVNQIVHELPMVKEKTGPEGEPATIKAVAGRGTKARDSVRKLTDTVGQRAERISLVADRVSPTLKKAVVDPLMEGHRGMDRTDSAFHAEFFAKTKEITDVTGNLGKWLSDKETVLLNDESAMPQAATESASRSVPTNVVIDRAHRLAIYMHSLNPDNYRHMVDGGVGFRYSGSELRNRVFRIDEATVKKIQDQVRSNPEELKLTKVISDLLKNMGKEEARVYLEQNGIPLQLVDNYYHIDTMSIKRGMTPEEETISTEAKKQFSGIGLAKGRLQPRTESSIPIYINPITYDLAKSQEHNSAYVNLEAPLRSVSKILGDKTLKEVMSNSVGDKTHQILVKAAKDVAGVRDPAGDMNNFWGRSKNRMTTGLMALPNIFIPLKQPAALSRYMTAGFVRGDYLMKGLVDSILHPGTTERTMRENSPFYDRRSEVGARPETESVIKSQVSGAEYGGKVTWQKRAMQGIGWMETRGSVRPGMRGAVLQVIDDLVGLKEDGKQIPAAMQEKYAQAGIDVQGILAMKPEEIPDAIQSAAYRYAEFASEQTQTSGNPLLQSDIQRGSTSEQVLTSFMSEGFTAANLRRTAFLEGQRSSSVKGWLRVSGVFVGTLLLEPGYEMLVNRTRRAVMGANNPDLKKEAIYQFIVSAFSGIPIVNQVIQSIAAKAVMGWNVSNNSITPLDNLVNVGITAINGMLDPKSYKSVKSKTRLVEDIAGFLSAISGYAILPGVKLGEGIINALSGGQ